MARGGERATPLVAYPKPGRICFMVEPKARCGRLISAGGVSSPILRGDLAD